MDPRKLHKRQTAQNWHLEQIKTFWSRRYSNIWSFYCPLCRSSRKVPYRRRPGGVRQWSQVALTSIFFTIVCWHWFGWKGIVSIVPFWTVFELVYRGRMRGALSCPHCGFDPYLYLVDVDRTRREIDIHWRKKFAEKGIPFPEKPATPDPH